MLRRVTLPAALMLVLGIVALTVAILYAMGRPPICACGYVRLWGPPDSEHLFDIYSFTHMLHAPFFYLLIWLIDRGRLSIAKRLVLVVLMEAGWEIFENTPFIINRYQDGAAAGYTGDSIINSVGDLIAMLTGFLITASIPAWATAILFVATEVTLFVLIKNGFILDFAGLLLGSIPF